MIICFSGTGNSRYVANRLSEALSDNVIDLNEVIKTGMVDEFHTDRRLVIVTPTYAWRIPRVVANWLKTNKITGAHDAWFVMTCGSEIGNAARYNSRLCNVLGLNYMGTKQIVMPENYIAMFDAPDESSAKKIIVAAEPEITAAGDRIKSNAAFDTPRNNAYDRIMSGWVNPVFYKFFVGADAFTAGDGCIACNQCVRLCPLNNISIVDGRPVWGKNCTHCMACICRCPVEAIEYGKKSIGKPRYHLDS